MKTTVTMIIIAGIFLWFFCVKDKACIAQGKAISKESPILVYLTFWSLVSIPIAAILWLWGLTP